MFVRAKIIKNLKYGYLVQNIWKKDKVKQKVKKYLGKIINVDFDYIIDPKSVEDYDWNKPTKIILREIIADFFLRKGFIQKQWRLIKEDLVINLSTCKIKKDNKDVVLELNGRYIYGAMFRYLQNFYEPEEEYESKGVKLAQAFSDMGISIEKDIFVKLYQKIYS